jgi:hypothetical protein
MISKLKQRPRPNKMAVAPVIIVTAQLVMGIQSSVRTRFMFQDSGVVAIKVRFKLGKAHRRISKCIGQWIHRAYNI